MKRVMKLKTSSSFEQGDIIVAAMRFAEQAGAKRRPLLVISRSKYNEQSQDLVVLKITSKNKAEQYYINLSQDGLESGTLKADSVIMADKPAFIYKGIITRQIGRITQPKLAEVKEKLKGFYGL